MAERLIFLLGDSPGAPLRWGRYEDARLIEGGWMENAAGLPALGARAAADFVAALLPGEQTAARRMASAPRGAAKARAAALYLMEDELGESADQLHVAAAGDLAIAVKTAIVEDWLAAFAAAGIELDLLSADYLALPSSADQGVIIFDEGRVVAAVDRAGFALEDGLFDALAPRLFETGPARLRALGAAPMLRRLPDAIAVESLGAADDARLLDLYAAALAEAPAPNFLQGRYQRRRALAPMLRPWRRAGALAAAAAALFVVSLAAEGVRADAAARTWTEAARRVHGERFPEAAAEDPVTHARRALAKQGSDASFLLLAARFAGALEKNDAVEIERIRFNAARGEFIVSVKSRSDSGIEELKQTLAAAGVATQDSGGYRRAGVYWSGDLLARTQ